MYMDEFWEGDVQNSLLEEQAYRARFLGVIHIQFVNVVLFADGDSHHLSALL